MLVDPAFQSDRDDTIAVLDPNPLSYDLASIFDANGVEARLG